MLPKFKLLKKNYSILRAAVDKVGEEFEIYSQEDLDKLLNNENGAYRFDKTVNGVSMTFDLQNWGKDRKSEYPGYCINVYGLPTLFGVKPSYHFFKKPDGTVCY